MKGVHSAMNRLVLLVTFATAHTVKRSGSLWNYDGNIRNLIISLGLIGIEIKKMAVTGVTMSLHAI